MCNWHHCVKNCKIVKIGFGGFKRFVKIGRIIIQVLFYIQCLCIVHDTIRIQSQELFEGKISRNPRFLRVKVGFPGDFPAPLHG